MSVFYDGKQALYDVSLDIPDKTVTALIGPSAASRPSWWTMNRMNDTISGAKVTGRIAMDDEDINDRSIDPVLAARGWALAPASEPLSEVDLRKRRLRPQDPRVWSRPSPRWTVRSKAP